ncbi:HAD-like domain-containing protein [Apiospora arundinis]|uniref:Phosphoglycolate phosphatase n=1 Tax=Apiospora arundinis TaxID=335852 RepID=A0ABR2JAV5_9PEZI
MSIKLVIFDFDGTLFDTHRSIAHCIKLTFETLLPAQAPSEAEVHRLISSGAGLQDTFKALHPDVAGSGHDSSDFDEDKWTTTYRSLYAEHGQPLITPFPGASELLASLRARAIPVAIVSNKGVAAVATALKNNGLGDSVPEDFIVGDKTPGASRKPDPGSYANVLLPAMKAHGYADSMEASSVLVVGDTEADIRFATNIGGARSVWCRYGYGDKAKCEKLLPDFTVDSLQEIEEIIAGSQ